MLKRAIATLLLLFFCVAAAQATVTSNVHNAPGWLHSHSYTVPSAGFPPLRANNGAGWNEGAGTYNPGSALNSYQLVGSAGANCTSAASGGPSGTGTNISDGTCTWNYVSGVDYITLTGWLYDNVPCATLFGSPVLFNDFCVSDTPLRAYRNLDHTTSSGETCSITPTGTGGTITPGDGCSWVYVAPVTYTSQVSHIPTQRWTSGFGTLAVAQMSGIYTANLWNDLIYDANSTPENCQNLQTCATLTLQGHQDATDDQGFGEGNGTAPNYNNRMIIQAAPGESFHDYSGGATALGAPSQKYGVMISTTSANPFTTWQRSALIMRDQNVFLINLQIHSTNGSAIWGSAAHDNFITATGNIIESTNTVNAQAAFECDGLCVIDNNLILNAGPLAVQTSYASLLSYNTIVQTTPVTDSIGYAVGNPDGCLSHAPCAIVANNAFIGFDHTFGQPAAGSSSFWITGTNHNATTVANPDPGNGNVITPVSSYSVTIANVPGASNLYSVSAASEFVNASTDFRLKAGASFIGAAASIGTVTMVPIPSGTYTFNPDTPDVLNQARPNVASYDIGAAEYYSTTPPAITGPGRMMLR